MPRTRLLVRLSPFLYCILPCYVDAYLYVERVEVDKAAAGRFIKHAIAQSQMQWKKTAAEDMQDAPTNANPSSSSTEKVPVKVTEKMRARAVYEAQLKNESDQDEAGLEVFDEDEDLKDGVKEEDVDMEAENDRQSKVVKGHGKGKQREQEDGTSGVGRAGAKRRRPVLDPFAGGQIFCSFFS